MNITLGDAETTALIPVAIKAGERMRKNARVRDDMKKYSLCGWLFTKLLPKMNDGRAAFEW